MTKTKSKMIKDVIEIFIIVIAIILIVIGVVVI